MLKPATEEQYNYGLECLPPALWLYYGFLVGEPATHRVCKVSGHFRATYTAFFERNGKYYENDEPLTIPEFRAFDLSSIPP
jgi:hypothetical protein